MRHHRPVCRPVWPTPPRPKGLCGHLPAEERLESPGPCGQRDCPAQPSPGRSTSNRGKRRPRRWHPRKRPRLSQPRPGLRLRRLPIVPPLSLHCTSVVPPLSLHYMTEGQWRRQWRDDGGAMEVSWGGWLVAGRRLVVEHCLEMRRMRSGSCRRRLLPGHQVHPAHSAMECCGRLDHKSAPAFPASHWLGS